MERVPHRQRAHVHVDVIGDARRVGGDFEVADLLLEEPALRANTFGRADEDERDANRDALARDQFLKIDVHEGAVDGVPLDLTDQRAGGTPAKRELDDGARSRELVEQAPELARADGQRLGSAGVPVDDSGHAARRAQLARDALAGLATKLGVERCGGHMTERLLIRER